MSESTSTENTIAPTGSDFIDYYYYDRRARSIRSKSIQNMWKGSVSVKIDFWKNAIKGFLMGAWLVLHRLVTQRQDDSAGLSNKPN
jgi:hypothetical protein